MTLLTIAEAASQIAAKKLSPVELAKAQLERIRRLDPQLDSFLLVTEERALADAKAAEARQMAGTLRGKLDGIPIAHKDIYNTAGIRTTAHSKLLEHNVPARDAHTVKKWADAGTVMLGKLATHEFAFGGPSFDLPWPPARNPWNTDHHPGGSSSGSGSGVAAGLFPMALGSDTGGSVRNPASCCGIVGLKPTYGLVSRRGVFPLSFTLDHVGPMTRTVTDNALMLETLAGHDPLDPGSAAVPNGHYAAALDRPVRGLRVGFVRHFHEVDLPAEPEVTAALDHVARTLQLEGMEVRDVTVPSLDEFRAINRVILQSEAWAIHEPWLQQRPGDYGQLARRQLMTGAFFTAGDYTQAARRRLEMIAEVEAVLREVDVLLCASSMDPACRIDRPADLERTYPRQARTPFNVTGHPAIAMMAGLSADGLPLSVQFAGRYFDEATVLQVARAWERASGVDRKHPAIL